MMPRSPVIHALRSQCAVRGTQYALRSTPTPPLRITRYSSRPAFTLVELLVVLGIVALLVSILLPALSRARQQAQRTACMSNLRQIGAAILTYAVDHRGCALPFELYTPNGSAFQNTPWPLLLVEAGYVAARKHKDLPAEGTFDGPNVFRCPSGEDRLLLGQGPADPWDPRGGLFQRCGMGRAGFFVDNWYALNATRGDATRPDGAFGIYPFRAYPAQCAPAGTKDYRVQRFLRTRRAADVVLAYDGSIASLGNLPASLHARHDAGRTTNLLLGDGRVENHPTRTLPCDPHNASHRTGLTAPASPLKWRLDGL